MGSAKNLRTTLAPTGIGTSFQMSSNSGETHVYFVSTTQIPGTRYAESIVKIAGPTGRLMLPPKISECTAEGASNHIALARMCVSNDPSKWANEDIENYVPSQIIAFVAQHNKVPADTDSLANQFNDLMLRMSGLNYPDDVSKHANITRIAIGTAIGIAILFLVMLAA